MNADLASRVARALYALPNSLDQRMMAAVADAVEISDSFEDLPESVQRLVLHAEKYIGPYQEGDDDDTAVGEVAGV